MRTIKMEKAVNNNEWIEDEEKADPEVLPSLPGYHILVRPVSIKSKTKGGLLLPDSVKDDVAYLTTVGKVLAVGDLAYKDEDKFPNGKWCDIGDYVCYARHAGQKLYYKGVRLLLLFDDQIMMKVDDPTNLDMTYNLSN
jgi:co-chaperonin GroES (HSP10)|tara:strand:+ start:1467 stop:1883 length:417 start_codon:yes stop_codon:yes gene_type:complete